ncbi:MAG TPA: dienelactone hydrolase family protein [Rhizomicrobium sp.]
MRGRSAAWVFAMLVGLPRVHAAEMTQQTIAYGGASRVFLVYVPDRMKSPAPLLLLLHGSYDSGPHMVELWKDMADREGILLAAPNAWQTDGWRIMHDGPDFLHAVAQSVEAKYSIDDRRVYLFGQSGGAVFALDMAMLESQYFAAVAVHAGAWRQAAEFRIAPLAARKIPLKIIVGDRDEFFSSTVVRRTEDALKEDGFPAEVEIVPGQHHWYTPETAPSINESAWKFLSSYTLAADPNFAIYR